MSTIKVDNIQNSSGVEQYTAKAWVNFNGTGTVAIRAYFNVSSITDNGTGDYTINFTNPMPSINYCATFGACSLVALSSAYVHEQNDSVLRTATQLRIYTTTDGSVVADKGLVSVLIHN